MISVGAFFYLKIEIALDKLYFGTEARLYCS